MNTLPNLQLIPIGDLRESETNPRKHFAPGPLAELAESVKVQGIRQPILVRAKPGVTPYEIVAGARRYRAGKLAAVAAVPCLVSVMADWEAEEVQAIENLQREDLTELEEAESYHRMLTLKGEDGAPRYTVELLHQRFSISVGKIYQRLKLLDLPKAGREALEEGKLGARQAVLIGRIPDPAARAEALKLTLAPQHKKEPLTYVETAEMIGEKFMQGLKGAPFKLDDAALVPSAGACSACPKMTDNCKHLFAPEEAANYAKRKVCCDPTCFRSKLDAVWKSQTAAAKAEGKTVLSEKESREIFPDFQKSGEMDWSSPYVFIGDKPAEGLLKPEVEKVGSWRTLIEGAEAAIGREGRKAWATRIKADPNLTAEDRRELLEHLDAEGVQTILVPRVIARDQAGSPHELVERKLAIAAIEAAGEPIFAAKVSSGGASSGRGDAFAKERKADLERAKVRLAETLAGMESMHTALVAKWEPSPVWEAVFEAAMKHAGADGLWLIGKWKGLKFGEHNTGKDEAVAKWAMHLLPAERQALVPLMLIGQEMKWSGLSAGFEQISQAAGLGLEVKAIQRAAAAKLKEEKAAKKAAAKAPKGKKEKPAGDSSAAETYGWNENGVATKPSKSRVLGMPEGTHCEVRMAQHADGKWRIGLDLRSRTEGKRGMSYAPNAAGKKFKHEDEALVAACTEALPFFKDDPAAFKVLANEADPKVAAELEAEGGVAPVTVTTDRTQLTEWVRAHAEGMPAEEIARSYGVPLADVEGALAGKDSSPVAPEAKKARERKRVPIDATTKDLVRILHNKGRTLAEIAEALCISVPSAQNIKKELGLVKTRLPKPEPAAAPEMPAVPWPPPRTSATPACRRARTQRSI